MKTSQYEIVLMASQCMHHNLSSACTCTQKLRAFLEHSVSHESLLPFSWMRGNLTDHIKKKPLTWLHEVTLHRHMWNRRIDSYSKSHWKPANNLIKDTLSLLLWCGILVTLGNWYECHSKGVIHDYIRLHGDQGDVISRVITWCFTWYPPFLCHGTMKWQRHKFHTPFSRLYRWLISVFVACDQTYVVIGNLD